MRQFRHVDPNHMVTQRTEKRRFHFVRVDIVFFAFCCQNPNETLQFLLFPCRDMRESFRKRRVRNLLAAKKPRDLLQRVVPVQVSYPVMKCEGREKGFEILRQVYILSTLKTT